MFDVGVTRYLNVLWLSFLPVVAFAHHSLLSYDQSEIVEFEGEVVDVFWRNPHIRLTVRAVDEDGGERIWTVEGTSVNALERTGISAAIVNVGDRIRLAGHPSSSRDDGVQPVLLTLATGPSFVLNENSAAEFGLVDGALRVEMTGDASDASAAANLEVDVAPSRLGYSVGRWEDGTLIVETGRIDYPYFNDQGIPQSEAVEIVERFMLSADETRLDWTATLVDPETFTELITMHDMHWEWIPANEIKPYNCVVDGNFFSGLVQRTALIRYEPL